MSEIVKVQIGYSNDDWLWLGKLRQEDLDLLVAIADKMNDRLPPTKSIADSEKEKK